MHMQVIDGFLVVHNVDEGSSQIWDIKIGGTDWNLGLLKEGVSVDVTKALNGKYFMDSIEKKELKINDSAYKFYTE